MTAANSKRFTGTCDQQLISRYKQASAQAHQHPMDFEHPSAAVADAAPWTDAPDNRSKVRKRQLAGLTPQACISSWPQPQHAQMHLTTKQNIAHNPAAKCRGGTREVAARLAGPAKCIQHNMHTTQTENGARRQHPGAHRTQPAEMLIQSHVTAAKCTT